MLWGRLKRRHTAIPSSDVPSFFITVHDDPVSFLHAVGPHLRLREELANTILPFAEAAAAVGNTTFTTTTMAASTVTAENVGPTEVRRRTNDAVDSRESASPIYDRIHWITCWSQSAPVIMNDRNSNSNTDNNGNAQIGTPSRVDFVAMYGTSRSGPTPVFLAITDRRYPRDQGSGQPHDDEFTRVAMMAMVAKLGDLTEPRSVCSVFGSMPHVDIFSRAWQAHIGGSLPLQTMVRRRSRMMCHTKGREREHALHSIQQIQAAVPGIRLATAQDTGRVAQLCQLFALAMVS